MKNIKIGDQILTNSGTYSPVIGWLDIKRETETLFLYIQTNVSSISLTASHIIFTSSDVEDEVGSKYGSELKIGDILIHEETGGKVEIIKITSYLSSGYFASLTESGTIVVDGYLASCYASYPHWVAHTAFYPARTWPGVFLGNVQEGTGTYVTFLKSLGNLFNLRKSAVPTLLLMDNAEDEF